MTKKRGNAIAADLFYEELHVLAKDDLYVPTKTFFLFDQDDEGICPYMASRAIKSLFILDKMATDSHIVVYLNTRGGCVDAGMSICDALDRMQKPVTIVATGACFSMGAVILQHADHRVMTKNALMMIHDGEIYTQGGQEAAKAWIVNNEQGLRNWHLLLQEKMSEVPRNKELPANMKDRMKKNNIKLTGKGFTTAEIAIIFKEDIVFTATESLQLNLIDEIL